MKNIGFIGAVVVALTMTGQMAQAQATPAEFPPASFTGNQYVDSRGCAFVRAGVGGNVNWVPRVSRTREQLCNFQPSLAQQVAPTRAPSAPNPLAGLPDATVENSSPIDATVSPVPPAPRPAPTPAPAPRVAAAPTPAPAPAPRPTAGGPIQTVASLTTTPRLIQPIATATPPATPRVITAPAPVVPPEPAERRTTLAEACDGRFGIQTGFISAATREPIDCGPAPAGTPVVAPVPVPAPAPVVPEQPRITLAEACDGRFGIQARFISAQTGDPIDCGPAPVVTPVVAPVVAAPTPVVPAAPEPRRLTLAQACAEIAETGRPLTNAATGLPVRCAPQQQPAVQPRVFAGLPGPAVPSAPATAPTPVAPTITAPVVATVCDRPGSRYLMAGTGLPVRCGPQAQNPYTTRAQLAELAQQAQAAPEVTRRATAPATASLFENSLFGTARVPASNPQVYRAEPIRPPSGYERVWGDGRLNERRGLPHQQTAHVYHENATVVPAGSTVLRQKATTTPASNGHRYVQVGSFGDLGNAQATIRRFQQMGLPISAGRSGGAQVVALGPFGDASALQRALQAARSAGFGDAYTRN
ncbi:SPOR domain-containing protein [Yoonia sp. 208BN28-4]|uniref:SPOR domain-containing protein n=1 Tax=Yoonia sp. 208BN28-4 TaxID=3126505 RepID=UPI0030A9BC8C